MKNLYKLLGIAVLAMAIVFSFAACNNSTSSGGGSSTPPAPAKSLVVTGVTGVSTANLIAFLIGDDNKPVVVGYAANGSTVTFKLYTSVTPDTGSYSTSDETKRWRETGSYNIVLIETASGSYNNSSKKYTTSSKVDFQEETTTVAFSDFN
jgi:hypothetical protein